MVFPSLVLSPLLQLPSRFQGRRFDDVPDIAPVVAFSASTFIFAVGMVCAAVVAVCLIRAGWRLLRSMSSDF